MVMPGSSVRSLVQLLVVHQTAALIATPTAARCAVPHRSGGISCAATALALASRNGVQVAGPEPSAAGAEPQTKRTALVLAWFYSSQREREFVRRLYLRNGFTDCIVLESPVNIYTKPRGWYRTMRRNQKRLGEAHDLSQHFDVVHCMSGGFLHLYTLIRSGVQLRCDTLLFDSTPILPKPAAFTRFARAYMESEGLTLPLKLLPRQAQERMVNGRWAVALRYVRTKHKVLNALGRRAELLDTWATAETGATGLALAGKWDELEAAEVCSRVFSRPGGSDAHDHVGAGEHQCAHGEVVFLYNPSDPFLDAQDVERVMEFAAGAGYKVKAEHTEADHVKTMFTSPRKVFGLLQPSPSH